MNRADEVVFIASEIYDTCLDMLSKFDPDKGVAIAVMNLLSKNFAAKVELETVLGIRSLSEARYNGRNE